MILVQTENTCLPCCTQSCGSAYSQERSTHITFDRVHHAVASATVIALVTIVVSYVNLSLPIQTSGGLAVLYMTCKAVAWAVVISWPMGN